MSVVLVTYNGGVECVFASMKLAMDSITLTYQFSGKGVAFAEVGGGRVKALVGDEVFTLRELDVKERVDHL